jgi:hypothetical protein
MLIAESNLNELVAAITERNRHDAVSRGPAVSKEPS